MLGSEIVAAAQEIGRAKNYNGAVHPEDNLLHFIITYSAQSIAGGFRRGIAEYFDRGALDAKQVLDVMSRLGHGPEAAVLEFASGFGRVTRHINLPNFVASDIHPRAAEFIRNAFGIEAVPSAADPRDFDPRRTFDFIFVLSLFSHLPDKLFGPWLRRLYDLLKPGGHLMFTTHGTAGAANNPMLAPRLPRGDGFAFFEYTDQPDLAGDIYGTIVVTPEYVQRKLSKWTKGHVVAFSENAWWLIQDEWIVGAPR